MEHRPPGHPLESKKQVQALRPTRYKAGKNAYPTWQAAGNAVMLSKARATALCSLQGRQECLPYLNACRYLCVFRRIAPAPKIGRGLLCRGG